MRLEKELKRLSVKPDAEKAKRLYSHLLQNFDGYLKTINLGLAFSPSWEVREATEISYRDGIFVLAVDIYHKGTRVRDYSTVPQEVGRKIRGLLDGYEESHPGTEIHTTP